MTVLLDLDLIMNNLVNELGSSVYFILISSENGAVIKSYINEEEFNKVFTLKSFAESDLENMNIRGRNPHNEMIIYIASYWIYRIRCSIAHHKIGEYLFSWKDENFIVDFGEPLLREVVIQCLKNEVTY